MNVCLEIPMTFRISKGKQKTNKKKLKEKKYNVKKNECEFDRLYEKLKIIWMIRIIHRI